MGVLASEFIDLPDWLTLEFVLRIMDSKVFSAIYWGAAAIVAIIGFIARIWLHRADEVSRPQPEEAA